MDGKPKGHEAFHGLERPMNPDFEPQSFREKEAVGWLMPHEYTAAVALHLETYKYTDEAYHQGTLKRIHPSELGETLFFGWRNYRSDSDAGSQRYRRAWRQGDDPKSGIWRDTSWVTVGLSVRTSGFG